MKITATCFIINVSAVACVFANTLVSNCLSFVNKYGWYMCQAMCFTVLSNVRLDTRVPNLWIPVDIPAKISTGTGYPYAGTRFPRLLHGHGYALS